MRLISLIIALLIIGALLYKQLGTGSSQINTGEEGTLIGVPKVPTKPSEVQAFEKDINDFVNENAKETARRVKEAEGKN